MLNHLPAQEGFAFIENFLREMTEAVLLEGGSVNNLTGDGFLAQFGIGHEGNDHAFRAVNCAIEMRTRLLAINRERHVRKEPTISIGVGIHSGQVAGGTIRLGARRSFLLIGDSINLAARIEGLTKDFAVDILVSEKTYERARMQFQFLAMPARSVKGISDKVVTFWIPPNVKSSRNYPQESLK